MAGLPSGTVTFLFTDIQGSTRLAREHPETWDAVQARHHALLRQAIEYNQGYVFQIIGDAFCAAFHIAGDALRAAVNSQTSLHSENWGDAPIKVRMGIHTGKAEIRENGEYQGYLAMSRVQRLMSAGHGGQVLVSAASQELLLEYLPDTVSLRDLGERRLKDLIRPEHIYQLVIPGLPVDFPPLKTLDLYRHNLPVQLTSFIGRQKEMQEVKQAMATHRLVTLTGVGGTGKTRLALQVAADLLDRFPDGIWFIDLAPVTDPSLIIQTVLSAVGIPDQPGLTAQQQLLDHAQKKKLLLLLDNCEHLLEACGELVNELLHHARDVKVLATSREALGVPGEMIWQVPSLSLPDVRQMPVLEQLSQYEAVQLFIERATLIQPHFQITNANAPAIAQICFRLDGIPLAIELAAARVRTMAVDQIHQRLDDRFRLLTGGSRVTLERHQTLRAAIDWSYNLLSEPEKILHARLAVFVGGWTLEAAEQVCSGSDVDSKDVFDLLAHLVDKSLVILDESHYRMLETTRQYAREKLLDTEAGKALRERHYAYFVDLAEQADHETRWAEKQHWKNRLTLEEDNFRAALEWSVSEQNTGMAVRLLAVWWTNAVHHFYELQDWFNRVSALPEPNAYPALYVRLLNQMAGSWWLRGNNHLAKAVLEESQAICSSLGVDGEIGLADSLVLQGEIALDSTPEVGTAQTLFEQSLELYQKHGHEQGVASVIARLGHKAMAEQKYEEAIDLFLRARAKCKELGDLFLAAFVLNEPGEAARCAGDYERARRYYQQGIQELKQLGFHAAASTLMGNCAWVNLHQGDPGGAQSQFRENLEFSKEDGNTHGMLYCLAGLASSLAVDGKPEQALRLFSAFERLYGESGLRPLDQHDRKEVDRYLARAREQLDETTFAKAWSDGGGMSLDQAIAFALEETRE